MVYEVTELAMKHLTIAQVKALASLDGWRANRIYVECGHMTNEGTFMVARVSRRPDGAEVFSTMVTIEIAPSGVMRSV